MSAFRTDALNPSSLPSASLGRPRSLRPNTARESTAANPSMPLGGRQQAELDKVHEEWNMRIDREVKGVADGLKELVRLADLGPDPRPLPSLPLKPHLATLINSTRSLRNTAHELKLLLILSDDPQTARRRDAEASLVRKDVEKARTDVGEELVGGLGGRSPGQSRRAHDTADGPENEDRGGNEQPQLVEDGDEDEDMAEVA